MNNQNGTKKQTTNPDPPDSRSTFQALVDHAKEFIDATPEEHAE